MSRVDSNSRANDRTSASESSDIQRTIAAKKHDVKEEGEAEVDDLRESYNERKKRLQDQNNAAVNHIREHKAEIQHQGSKSISELKQKQSDEMAEIRDKYKAKLAATQANNKGKLDELHQSSLAAMRTEVTRGEEARQAIVAKNRAELDKLKGHGDAEISERIKAQDERLKQFDSNFEKQYRNEQAKWDSKFEQQNRINSSHLVHDKEAYAKALETQRDHHESFLAKNQIDQDRSVQVQKDMFQKELLSKQSEFVQQQGKYAGKEDDPFYRIQDRGSSILETPTSYILKAYIPEYEKDQVHVQIQNDKAVVSGQRGFADQVQDDDKKFSTNAFQSFREEFAIDKPILAKNLHKERVGDWIHITIPKINTYRRG